MADQTSLLRDDGERTYDPLTGAMIRSAPVPRPYNSSFAAGVESGLLGIDAGLLANELNQAQIAGDVERVSALRAQGADLDRARVVVAPRVTSYTDVNGLGDAIDYGTGLVGQGLASMAPVLGAAAAARFGAGRLLPGVSALRAPAAGAGAFGAGYGLERNEALAGMQADPANIGLDPEYQRRLAEGKGIASGALEAVVPAALIGGVGRAATTLGTIGRGAAGESLTEGAQTKVGQTALGIANPDRDTSGDNEELINAMIGGALTGGGISATPAALETGAERLGEVGKFAAEKLKPVKQRAAEVVDQAKDLIDEQGRKFFKDIPPEQIVDNIPRFEEQRTRGATSMKDWLLAEKDLDEPTRARVAAIDPSTGQGQVQLGVEGAKYAGRKQLGNVIEAVEQLDQRYGISDTAKGLADGFKQGKTETRQSLADFTPGGEAVLLKYLNPELRQDDGVISQLPRITNGLLSVFGRFGEIDASDVSAIATIYEADSLFGGNLDKVVGELNEFAAASALGDTKGTFEKLAAVIPAMRAAKDKDSVVSQLTNGRNTTAAARMIDEINAAANGKSPPAAAVKELASTYFGGSEPKARLALNAYAAEQLNGLQSIMGEIDQSQAAAQKDEFFGGLDEVMEDVPDYDGMAQGRRVDESTGESFEFRTPRGMPFFLGSEGQRTASEAQMRAIAKKNYSDAETRFTPYGEYLEGTVRSFEANQQLNILTKNLTRTRDKELSGSDKTPEQAAKRQARITALNEQIAALEAPGTPMEKLNRFSVGRVAAKRADEGPTTEDLAEFGKLVRAASKDEAPEKRAAREATYVRMTAPVFDEDGNLVPGKKGKPVVFSAESMVARQGVKDKGKTSGESETARQQRLFSEALGALIAEGYELTSNTEDIYLDRAGTRYDTSRGLAKGRFIARDSKASKEIETLLAGTRARFEELLDQAAQTQVEVVGSDERVGATSEKIQKQLAEQRDEILSDLSARIAAGNRELKNLRATHKAAEKAGASPAQLGALTRQIRDKDDEQIALRNTLAELSDLQYNEARERRDDDRAGTPEQEEDPFAQSARYAPEATGAGVSPREQLPSIQPDRPKTAELSPIVRRVDEMVLKGDYRTVDTPTKAKQFLELAAARTKELREMTAEQVFATAGLAETALAYEQLFDELNDLTTFFTETEGWDKATPKQHKAMEKFIDRLRTDMDGPAVQVGEDARQERATRRLIRAENMSPGQLEDLRTKLSTKQGLDSVVRAVNKSTSLVGLRKLLANLYEILGRSPGAARLHEVIADRIETIHQNLGTTGSGTRVASGRPYEKDWAAVTDEVTATDAREAAEQFLSIFSDSVTAQQRRLLEFFSSYEPFADVELQIDDATDMGGPSFSPLSNTIFLTSYEALQESSEDNKDLLFGLPPVSVFLHEATHAATLIEEAKDTQARQDLDRLVQHVRANVGEYVSKTEYGLQDTQEFLAEAFSNPDFQAMLKSIPALNTKTFKSAWDQFKGWVAKLLGYTGDPSALEEALTIGAHLIRNNSAEQTRNSDLGGKGTVKTGRPKKPTQAEYDALKDELVRMRGDQIKLVFERAVGAMGSAGTWSRTGLKRTIEVAINLTNPTSTLYHEAMHDFFNTLLTDAPSRELKQQLLDFAGSAPVYNQLTKLLANSPKRLKQIKEGSDNYLEERLAYAFQFWNEGLLRTTPAQKNVFQKIFDFIRSVLGVVSQDEKIDRIFTGLRAGKLREPNTVVDVLRARGIETTGEKFKRIATPIADGIEKMFYSAGDRLRAKNIPALNTLADRFLPEEGKGRGGLQFMQRRAQAAGQKMNDLYKAIEGVSKPELLEALENLQAQRAPTSAVETRVRAFLDGMYKYMDQAGVKLWNPETKTFDLPVNFAKNYFPRVWDAEKINADPAGWVEAMKAVGYDARTAQAVQTAVSKGMGAVELEESENHIGFTPFSAAISDRTLSKIDASNAALFTKFQKKDLVDILSTYVYQAVHRAEYARSFGNDGELIQDLLKQAEKEGATSEDLIDARNAVAAMQGTLRHDFNPALRRFMGGAMTLQNVILLPFSLFSSLVDPLGIALRTGEMGEAWTAFKEGVKGLAKDMGSNEKDAREEMARTLGIVDANNMLDAMGSVYNGVYMSKFLKDVNKTYFKWNGMDAWNRAMRVSAMSAGQRFIVKNADNERYMKELGITKSDIKLDAEGNLALTQDQGLSAAQEQRIQSALFKFVDSAVLRPNAAHRPIWGSDPRFQLLFHLKQFTFSFHNTILKRVRNEMDAGEAVPAWILLSYVPFMLASDFLKGNLLGTWDTSSSVAEVAMNAVQRSSVLGVGTFGLDAVEDVARGNLPGTQFLGPTFDHAWSGVQTALNAPGTSGEEFLWRSLPASQAVESVVR